MRARIPSNRALSLKMRTTFAYTITFELITNKMEYYQVYVYETNIFHFIMILVSHTFIPHTATKGERNETLCVAAAMSYVVALAILSPPQRSLVLRALLGYTGIVFLLCMELDSETLDELKRRYLLHSKISDKVAS